MKINDLVEKTVSDFAQLITDLDLLDPSHNFNTLWGKEVLDWGRANGRTGLPWQGNNPYYTWISEIMLQQTQVETVKGYFINFINKFPTVLALADSSLTDVLKSWEGLGYYRRARFIHQAAQIIKVKHGGVVPVSEQDLIELPGIGKSTARAIISLGYNKPAAILDGNVIRVLTRVFGIEELVDKGGTQKKLWAIHERIKSTKNARLYTQTMMDIGATLCVKAKPNCQQCPFNKKCIASLGNKQSEIPRKSMKITAVREEVWNVVRYGDNFLMHINNEKVGVWQDLCVFKKLSDDLVSNLELDKKISLTHAFSHYTLKAVINIYKVKQMIEMENCFWVNKNATYTFPKPVKEILEQEFK